MGENDFAPLPTALYGVIFLMCAVAWLILQSALVSDPANAKLHEAIGRDVKGKLSFAAYVAAVGLAFVNQWIAVTLYVIVALMWLIPDRRFEAKLLDEKSSGTGEDATRS